MNMSPFTSIIALILLLGLGTLLPIRSEKTSSSKKLGYKYPLDVTVDEKGRIARVFLSGPGTVAEVDLDAGKVIRETTWPKEKPRPNKQAIPEARAATQYGERQLVTVFQQAKFELPATQISQGWVFTHRIDVSPARVVSNSTNDLNGERGNHSGYDSPTRNLALLDSPTRGFADPSDIASSRNRYVFVASAGDDSILAVDVPALKAHLRNGQHDRYPSNAMTNHRKEDLLSVRRYAVRRLPTQSNPRRLALSGDGRIAVASNYLADSLTVIDAINLKVLKHIPLGGLEPDAVRRGEILFNSAKLTFQGQFSCASCHPNGGSDGLNWDLTRDGIGNFKNTKSLLGIKDTAPYGWLGSSPTLADRIRGTLQTLHRYEPSEEEISDLTAYLESLPPSEPMIVKEADKHVFARGKSVFDGKGRCVSCHRGSTFDDGKLHNVGTGNGSSEDRFNTPTLLGVGRTAPYLHDGRSATLEELFAKHNLKQQHGEAHELSAEEMKDLLFYIRHQ